MTVSFHKFGDFFFPGTGDVKVRRLSAMLVLRLCNAARGVHRLVFSNGVSG